MPIVDVQLVRATDLDLRADLAAMLADALGEVFGAEPRRVWVRLAVLAAQHYAENAATYPLAEMPVFVTVLHAVPPEGQTRAAEALVLPKLSPSAFHARVNWSTWNTHRRAMAASLSAASWYSNKDQQHSGDANLWSYTSMYAMRRQELHGYFQRRE